MRKIILFAGILVFFSNPCFAKCNYMDRCTEYSIDQFAKLGQFFSNTTGSTTLAENFANQLIKQKLQQVTNQDFDVDLQAFSLGELIQGKFKSLTISGKNVELEGIHISSLKVQTLCGFNNVNLKNRPLTLDENIVLGFWLEVSENDLKNTLQNPKYMNQLNKINLSSAGIRGFQIYPSTINISDGVLYITINALIFNQQSPIDILMSYNINIKDEKIVTYKTTFANLFHNFSLSGISDILNPTKYLNFPVNLYGNSQAEIQIRDLSFSGNSMLLHGMIFLPKTS
ncbi:MAG: LmeA family phospholipid-binding protein [Candidatus Gastranaerophilales bacterium]|nr:LmeA family phospholipid-binding protein [Candidatus Gastranaerophilales bacterium]